MATSDTDLLHLALLAHESAADADVWSQFLERFSKALGADVTVIQRHDLGAKCSTLFSTYGMTSRFTSAYNEHYSRLNVWRDNGSQLYAPGRIIFDEQLYPRRLLKRTEFYNDFLIGNGGTHCVSGVVARQGDDVITLAALRADPRPGFESNEGQVVARLLPHVARAHATASRLRTLEAGETALGALRLGVLLLAQNRRVVFCNPAAERILRAGDGLTLHDGKLVAATTASDGPLQRLVDFAVAPGGSLVCPPDVLVARSSDSRPYHVTAGPLRRAPRPYLGTTLPVAIAVVNDPERHRPAAPAVFRQWFGLTAKEAALTAALAEGATLERAAEQLTMRYETARTHLRRVLTKTGTSRQVELILLFERMCQQFLDAPPGE